jgi:hypothetical protein
MSPRISLPTLLLSIALAGCGTDTATQEPVPDPIPPAPAGNPLARVAFTSLPGATTSAGIAGTFISDITPEFGRGTSPKLSNTVISALPGTPAKPLFVGQDIPYEAIIVSVDGKPGYYKMPGDGGIVHALDLVAAIETPHGPYTVLVATKTNGVLSAPTALTMLIDPHAFITAGDLENHDSDGSNLADLFGTILERKQGTPPAPVQVLDSHDNNADIVGGIKGPAGPLDAGHREVLWDGVPEVLRNQTNFSATFFDRQLGGAAGVQGGVIFTESNGTGQEVNDALAGVIPDPGTVGPPGFANAALGGDFSNHNPVFAGNLLAFTQSASFAPLGTTITDITFHVAASDKPAVVSGLGIVFTSVDKPQSTFVEFFDDQDRSIARVYAPVQSKGPFPNVGPLSATKIPYSFAGYVDHEARIARVRVVSGEVPVDEAANDMPEGTQDVVIFDDVYYGEPRP